MLWSRQPNPAKIPARWVGFGIRTHRNSLSISVITTSHVSLSFEKASEKRWVRLVEWHVSFAPSSVVARASRPRIPVFELNRRPACSPLPPVRLNPSFTRQVYPSDHPMSSKNYRFTICRQDRVGGSSMRRTGVPPVCLRSRSPD
jgi:hypothetical protein